MEQGLTKQQVISELAKSPHGKLAEYVKVGLPAARQDPDFFAHLVAWTVANSQIRDAKVALPVIALATKPAVDPYREHSAAVLASLDPRNFLRAMTFSREVPEMRPAFKIIKKVAVRYLREREADRKYWDRSVLQYRQAMRTLYKATRMKHDGYFNDVLFKNQYPSGSVWETIRDLSKLSARDAVLAVQKHDIPFLVALPALGEKLKNTEVALELIKSMSPTELVTNAKLFEKMDFKNNPVLRSALREAVDKAAKAPRQKTTLKTSVAAAAVQDEGLKESLKGLQEKQLDALQGPDGDWLVLADMSGSMHSAIDTAKEVAGVLARTVKGKVYLVFFNVSPLSFDVTGKTLEEIQSMTRGITANGGTSIGCGLDKLLSSKIEVGGIAIVSDGADNTSPFFVPTYTKYAAKMGIEPTVYFYHMNGEADRLTSMCKTEGISLMTFDLTGSVDHYSIPNLVMTMRSSRYSLLDEIMASPLRRLDDVLKRTTEIGVFPRVVVTA